MMVAVRIAANQRGKLASSHLLSPLKWLLAHTATFTSQSIHSTLLSPESHHFSADYQMLICTLKACKRSHDLRTTIGTHGRMIKLGYEMYPSLLSLLIMVYLSCGCLSPARQLLGEIPEWDFGVVPGNLMIASFMKMREVDVARKLFYKMPIRDVVTWNSIIGGLVKNVLYDEALSIFKKMLKSDMEPDAYTFSSLLTACARLGAIDHAKWAHNLMLERKIEPNYILSSALIDMYSKCGDIETAKGIFHRVERSNVCVWNAVINGLATHGLAIEAVKIFTKMESEIVVPDSITFIALLTACSHGGLVDEGRRYFDIMKQRFSIRPELEHYGAMVDLLGRAGLLNEAYEMIKEMPMKPDAVIWRAFLSACRIHKNSELGEVASTEISHLSSGDYVLLSNIYCSMRKWDSAEKLRHKMKQKGVRKKSGRSSVELDGVIHRFKAGDRSHPETSGIYETLELLIKRTKMAGFNPATELVLMDISEEEKEENLNFHSEKLALAYGILKSSPGTCIQVTKNLRTCPDCHSWIKMVSKVINRVVIVRDRIRFHHFEGGFCTCGDYW